MVVAVFFMGNGAYAQQSVQTGVQGADRNANQWTLSEKAAKALEQDSTVKLVEAVRTLEGAFLNSTAGGNRLGGTKIGFLTEGIVMEMVDTTKDLGAGMLYKVRLSENRMAYIMPENVEKIMVTPQELEPVIAGSASVANKGKVDKISIGLESMKPYLVREELDPHIMTVDIYGVNNNINWLTQKLDLEAIKSVDLIQLDGDILRVKIVFNKNISWGYSVGYMKSDIPGSKRKSILEISIRHLPEKFSLRGMVVGIDAGHGGPESPGAISHKLRLNEKDINLDMAYTLKRMLERRGAKVVLTREADYGIEMSERKRILLENDVDFLISLHNNAAGPKVRGTSTYYKYIVNRELARCILEQVLTLDDVTSFGLVGNFNFSLNQSVEYPNALLEGLFMSNEQDEALLNNPDFRKKMMKKTLKGIENWLKYCKKESGKRDGRGKELLKRRLRNKF